MSRRTEEYVRHLRLRAYVMGHYLKVSVVRELLNEARDAKNIALRYGCCGRDTIERLKAGGSDDGRARCRDCIREELVGILDNLQRLRREDPWERAERVREAARVIEISRSYSTGKKLDENSRDCRVDEVDMGHKICRHGVRKRAHSLVASLGMLEDGELRAEERVRLANWNAESKPVASWRDSLRSDAILLEPGVDCLHGLRLGRKELLSLRVEIWSASRHGLADICFVRTSSLVRCCPYNGLSGSLTSMRALMRPSRSVCVSAMRMSIMVSGAAALRCEKPSGRSIVSCTRIARRTGLPSASANSAAKRRPFATMF